MPTETSLATSLSYSIENITDVSNSTVKTGQVASTVLTAAGELADQSHLLRQEVERYLAQLRVAS
ncbi:MAG: hypothetical protein WA322_13665 [Pseudolabrys sp.]